MRTKTLLFFIFCLGFFQTIKAQYVAPDFTATDIRGKSQNLYRTVEQNKFVILHFFTPGSDKSKTLAKKLDSLYLQYGKGYERLEILGLEQSTSSIGSISATYLYVNGQQLTFPHIDRSGGSTNASRPYYDGHVGSIINTNGLALVYPNKEVTVNISVDSVERVLAKFIKKKVYHYNMHIQTPYKKPLEEATFKLRHFDFVNQVTTPVITDMTGPEGIFRYSFDTNVRGNLAPNNICIEKLTLPTENVTTYDLILVSKHLIGSQIIHDKFKLIAADINNNGQVTVADIVELRKILLKMDEESQYLNSWRMFRMAPKDTTETNCFVFDLVGNQHDFEFVGVKIGDVSYICDGDDTCLDGSKLENRSDFGINIVDKELSSNQLYTMEIYPNDLKDFIGLQGTFHFDANKLAFIGFQPAQINHISNANFNLEKINQGIIPFTWNDVKGFDLDSQKPLFSIQFKAKQATKLSEAIALKGDKLSAEIYVDNFGAFPMQLNFIEQQGKITQNTAQINGNQLKLEIVEDSAIQFEIFDALGRVVAKPFEGKLNSGEHQILFEMETKGVFYARILMNNQLLKTIPFSVN